MYQKIILTVPCILISATALAQQAIFPIPQGFDEGVVHPGDSPAPGPRFLEREETPPLTSPQPVPDKPVSSRVRMKVSTFRFTGNTVFSDEELHGITKAYEGREITSAELHQVRQALTLHYVEKGYLNSGAMIPDQKIADGIIHIQLVEGSINRMRLEGNQGISEGYITDRLTPFFGPPMRLSELQDGLLLLRQSSLVEQVQAELKPGLHPGEGELHVRIKEASPFHVRASVANNRSPAIGGIRQEGVIAHDNLAGHGESFQFVLGKYQGGRDWNAEYHHPLTADDLTLSASINQARALVVEEPFSELEITSASRGWSVGLSKPLWKTPSRTYTLGWDLDRRETRTTLLGMPFSLSPGAEDGKTVSSAWHLYQEWVDRTPNQALAIRASYNQGVDWFGATKQRDQPDSRQSSLQGQLQFARRIGEQGGQFLVRFNSQWTEDELLSMDKFSVGGSDSVRGFRENHLTRDSGFAAGLELRWPLFSLPIPYLSKEKEGAVQGALFLDHGRAWNAGEDKDEAIITSAGLGVRWEPSSHVQTMLYWGNPLRGFPEEPAEKNLQDQGIHFKINLNLL